MFMTETEGTQLEVDGYLSFVTITHPKNDRLSLYGRGSCPGRSFRGFPQGISVGAKVSLLQTLGSVRYSVKSNVSIAAVI